MPKVKSKKPPKRISNPDFESGSKGLKASGNGQFNTLLNLTANPGEWGRFTLVGTRAGTYNNPIFTVGAMAGDFRTMVLQGIGGEPMVKGETYDFYSTGQIAKRCGGLKKGDEFSLMYLGERALTKGKFKGKQAHLFDIRTET